MALYPGLKQPGRETLHSPLSNTEDKITWSYTAIAPYVFKVLHLTKQKENFTFA
jgi:hypothetical protein